MIELPETYVLSEQVNKTLSGKTIARAYANTHPHGFATYTGDPATYNERLTGKKVTGSSPGTPNTCGRHVEILCGDMMLTVSTPIKYHAPGAKLPKSHQLLLEFGDGSHMSCSVQMWGSMLCYPPDTSGRPCSICPVCKKAPTPYDDAFSEAYFSELFSSVKQSMSVKEFIATDQRIPGIGNGVLQDVLWNAGVHPRRRLETFSANERSKLYQSLKSTLLAMREQGGRDTEKDLFGNPGGYKTILSKKTLEAPCQRCGSQIIRQAYLGGNIYYCPTCQPQAGS